MLFVNDIFTSISGEVGGWPQGTIVQFIRLQGCNLTCSYCDTKDSIAINQNEKFSICQICNYPCRKKNIEECYNFLPLHKRILLTGGEPLIQDIAPFISKLKEKGCDIAIETNGTKNPLNAGFDLLLFDSIRWAVDYKLDCPEKMNFPFGLLDEKSWVKVPILDWNDFDNAIDFFRILCFFGDFSANLAISPIGKWDIDESIKKTYQMNYELGLNIILNFQLHKLINAK